MQTHQIVSGFSAIKSELRTRTGRTHKLENEIRLWFSLSERVLYAHDYDDHSWHIIIAIYSAEGANVRLDPKAYGYPLILEATRSVSEDKIVKYLNVLYLEHGHIPRRFS